MMRPHTARAHAEGGEGLNQTGYTAPREGSKLKRMNAEPEASGEGLNLQHHAGQQRRRKGVRLSFCFTHTTPSMGQADTELSDPY